MIRKRTHPYAPREAPPRKHHHLHNIPPHNYPCEADKILVLEHGRLVEQGTHEELIAKPGLYRRIARIQNALEEELKQEGGGSNE